MIRRSVITIAIIPTEEYVQLDHMSNEERKIYDLVVRRFIGVLYPAYEYEQTTMKATVQTSAKPSVATAVFGAKGQIVLKEGWKSVYDNMSLDEEEDDKSGDQLRLAGAASDTEKRSGSRYFPNYAVAGKDEATGKIYRGNPAECDGESGPLYGV